jgi:SAM-dependent methyltransferase
VAIRILRRAGQLDPAEASVLTICSGAGGDGAFLRNEGFDDVTVSDFSEEALHLCEQFNPELKTKLLNAERLDLPDGSYDIALVQDGLSHLPRPVVGFTEMLRVARKAVIVIEPHSGLVPRLLGKKWDSPVEGVVHHVFRWDHDLLEQNAHSYLVDPNARVVTTRMWDHNLIVGKVARRAGRSLQLPLAKTIYGLLRPLGPFGNMMVSVVLKSQPEVAAQEAKQARSHRLEPA